jgi:Gene product 88
MARVANLLTRGNTKLGESIHAWSIPAVDTCPGRTRLCESVCYATGGRFRTHRVQELLQENLDQSLRKDFEARVVKEINRRGVSVLRVHVSGDFYDPSYARKWLNVARRSRRTTFYAYTRSWRLEEYRDVLSEMASMLNFHIWFSVDRETGTPEVVPLRVRLAFLQTEEGDDPGDVDLVFRTPALRSTRVRRIGLSLVCPTEQGASEAGDRSCTSCRRCFSRP